LPPGNPFMNVQSYDYWSSSTYAGTTYLAWSVYLSNGTVDFSIEDHNLYVWPVRSDS